jgi:protease-4
MHAAWMATAIAMLVGCTSTPFNGTFDGHVRGEGQVAATVQGSLEMKLPAVPEPGELSEVIVRPSPVGPGGARVAILDVDGLILNQNFSGIYSAGDNPVAAFREKLQAVAGDRRIRAVVLRINSPGGGVTASDILAEDLARFRRETGMPVVACLLDLATGGAYYLAVGADRIVAHPTTVTGGVGAILNLYNLEDAMAALNVRAEPVKSGNLVDMGSVTARVPDEARALLQEMSDGFRDRFRGRVATLRPAMTDADRAAIADGRVVPATKAERLKMVDRLGYLDDALDEAQGLAGISGAEIVQFQRPGTAARSMYAVSPNLPIQGEMIPLSYPGLDRSKTPTFLYLWQPDPTVLRQAGR